MTIILEQSTHTRTEDDITASTVQTQGQVPLTADNSIITTVANENDVVTLKQGEAGVLQRVVNAGANILQIFPALGQDLGNGVNNSITLAPNDHLEFLALNDITLRDLTPTALSAALGDVDGPASATDNAVARFVGTSGKEITDSFSTTLDDNGQLRLFSIKIINIDAGDDVTISSNSLSKQLIFDGGLVIKNQGIGNDPIFSSNDPTDPLLKLTGDLDVTGVLLAGELRTAAADVAQSGFLRMRVQDDIAWRNNGDSGDLLLSINGSDKLTFDGNVVATGSVLSSPLSDDLDFNGNKALKITQIQSNTTPIATVGFIALAKGDSIQWRNDVDNNNNGISWFEDDFRIEFNSNGEYLFSSSEADWTGSSLVDVNFIESAAVNSAQSAFLRLGNSESIGWRLNAGGGDVLLSVNASDELLFNGLPVVGLTNPLVSDLNFGGFKAINVLSIASNAAGIAQSGFMRLANTENISWRNNLANGDVLLTVASTNYLTLTGSKGISLENNDIIRWDNNDARRIANDTNGFIFDVPVSNRYDFKIADTDEYQFDATNADFIGNNIRNFGFIESAVVAVADGGAIRLASSQSIAWKSDVGSGNAQFFYGDGANDEFNLFATNHTLTLNFDANHTAPIIDTVVADLLFRDKDNTNAIVTYGQITTTIQNPLNGFEAGAMSFLLADGNNPTIPFMVLNEGDDDSIVMKKAIDLSKLSAAPDSQTTDVGRLYVREVNGANDGLFIKIRQAASIVEVQIV